MNDLTKEAISRELDPNRPLTGEWEHYLTGYEGSRCDRIEIPQQANEESRTGINMDKINRVSDDYRKISDEVDGQFFRDFRVEKNGYFSFSNVEIGE